MEEFQGPANDPVEKFLNSRFRGPVHAEFRQQLWRQTARFLHRRRRWKRAGYLGALAACYALGLATTKVWLSTMPTPGAPMVIRQDVQAHAEPSAPGGPLSMPLTAASPSDGGPMIPAFVLERMAQSCPESRSLLYRRAGDRYLAEGDWKSAVHCYSRSLDAGSPHEWAVSKEDNWLLMQLKTARQEENSNAKSAG
ncbi:MAG TPA: hypothetical protein VKU02_05060 [Gemmataceae bacterium]|nr:hypothetical protein [Gemmataceae bacterium]